MSKKEFYNKYIKDDRTEDEKMLDIIHQQAQSRRMNEKIDRQIEDMEKKSKQKKKDRIAFILVIAIFIALLTTDYFITKKGVESCVAGGHSESWCVVNG